MREGGEAVAGTAGLEDLEAAIGQFLLLGDGDVVRVVLAVAATQRLVGDPVWLLIVAPSSGSKTEIIMLLQKLPSTEIVSELTEHTLASGMKVKDGEPDPSLLARFHDGYLLLKDFTSVLSMRHESRQVVLAQLREVYDGRFVKHWGTGKTFDWKGRITVVAGVTAAIDKHHAVMAELGPRFLLFRPAQPDRRAMSRVAVERSDSADRRRAQLARSVRLVLKRLPTWRPALRPEHLESIVELADFVALARSPVERNRSTREIESAPPPEMPSRVAKQLQMLALGSALIARRRRSASRDIQLVARVALDSIPTDRRAVLLALIEKGKATITQLVQQIPGFSKQVLRRALEDLERREITMRSDTTIHVWSLRPEWSDLLTSLVRRKRAS